MTWWYMFRCERLVHRTSGATKTPKRVLVHARCTNWPRTRVAWRGNRCLPCVSSKGTYLESWNETNTIERGLGIRNLMMKAWSSLDDDRKVGLSSRVPVASDVFWPNYFVESWGYTQGHTVMKGIDYRIYGLPRTRTGVRGNVQCAGTGSTRRIQNDKENEQRV